MPDVFLSYATEDGEPAEAVYQALINAELKCWTARREIVPGRDWTTSIVQAITECEILLLIHSEAANKSRHVFREVQLAFENEKTVLPLKIDKSEFAAGLKYYLGPV